MNTYRPWPKNLQGVALSLGEMTPEQIEVARKWSEHHVNSDSPSMQTIKVREFLTQCFIKVEKRMDTGGDVNEDGTDFA